MRLAAVDLGATSGRVMAGSVATGRLAVEEVHRFPNGPVRVGHGHGATLYWDILGIYRETLAGVQAAHRGGALDGLGIDSWGVDYGLFDATGALLGNPVHYRDSRTGGVPEQVHNTVTPRELYDVTGLQELPFNTLYQLVSEVDRLAAAERMLLIPDLLGYWLTGQAGAERTNASTTQLYDVRSRCWATGLAERAGVLSRLLPKLRDPGTVIGTLLPKLAGDLSLPELPVIAVGSHDTASAVVGVPAEPGANYAYISSGTWSLVGLELNEPVLSEAACRETGQRPPTAPAETVRCIVDSLALAYRRTVRQAAEITGCPVDVVHIVGGGERNELLCQLTADACGVPLLAGPVEAAALGNVLMQARALGADLPDLATMRALVRATHEVRRYTPAASAEWDAAEARLGDPRRVA